MTQTTSGRPNETTKMSPYWLLTTDGKTEEDLCYYDRSVGFIEAPPGFVWRLCNPYSFPMNRGYTIESDAMSEKDRQFVTCKVCGKHIYVSEDDVRAEVELCYDCKFFETEEEAEERKRLKEEDDSLRELVTSIVDERLRALIDQGITSTLGLNTVLKAFRDTRLGDSWGDLIKYLESIDR